MPARRTRRCSRTTAVAVAALAIGAPAASARPAGEWPTPARPAVPSGPTVTRIVDSGFEWGSAAIGAGGAAVVLLLTATGATTLSRRHHTAP